VVGDLMKASVSSQKENGDGEPNGWRRFRVTEGIPCRFSARVVTQWPKAQWHSSYDRRRWRNLAQGGRGIGMGWTRLGRMD
jgi:hypothetical protein